MLETVLNFLFSSNFSWTNIIWLLLLIDCLANKKLSGSDKLGWAFFIGMTHMLGAICYFFAGHSYLWRLICSVFLEKQQKTTDISVKSEQTTPQPQEISDYTEGYQAQTSPPAISHTITSYNTIEQPQAIYPEMKQGY